MISILLLLMLVPLLLMMLFFNVAAFSFSRLGMSQEGAFLFLTASIIGSLINIPLSRRRIQVYEPRAHPFSMFFFYYPPVVREQVIYLNVGGAGRRCFIPLSFGGSRAPLLPSVCSAMV